MALSLTPLHNPDQPDILQKAFRDAYLALRKESFPYKATDSWSEVTPALKRNYGLACAQFFKDLGINNLFEHDFLVIMSNLSEQKDSKGNLVMVPDKGVPAATYRWLTRNRDRLTPEQVSQFEQMLALMEEVEADRSSVTVTT